MLVLTDQKCVFVPAPPARESLLLSYDSLCKGIGVDVNDQCKVLCKPGYEFQDAIATSAIEGQIELTCLPGLTWDKTEAEICKSMLTLISTFQTTCSAFVNYMSALKIWIL